MRWGRLLLGFVLGVTAGVTLGCASSEGNGVPLVIGILALSLGVLMTISAIHRPRPPALEPAEAPDWNPAAAPRLAIVRVGGPGVPRPASIPFAHPLPSRIDDPLTAR